MFTLLRRVGLPVAAFSLLLSLTACVVYPAGGGYYGRPHGYYYGGYDGGYYGHHGYYGHGGYYH